MSTSLRIVGITADEGEVAGDRYSTLERAQKALDDLDFALFSQRDVGLGSSAIIAYQIRFPDAPICAGGRGHECGGCPL